MIRITITKTLNSNITKDNNNNNSELVKEERKSIQSIDKMRTMGLGVFIVFA